jgi:hypothetical protein
VIRDAGEFGTDLARSLESESNKVFDWAVGKGFETRCKKCDGQGTISWHEGGDKIEQDCELCNGTGSGYRNFGEQIALCHSELAELLEAVNVDTQLYAGLLDVHKKLSQLLEDHRKGQNVEPDEHCPEFTKAEIEAADVIIRLMCMSGAYGWRIGRAVEAKMAFNYTRPPKHGKKY